MRKTIIAVFLLFPLCGLAEQVPVTIHVDANYQPYSYEGTGGKAEGFYIEVLREAFSRLEGFAVTMTPVPWERGKYIMSKGRGFGLTPAFYHGHDWPYLFPYSQPFYTETIIAVCSKETMKSPRPNWPDDFVGLRIGNVAGFDGWGGAEFWQLVKSGRIDYLEARGTRMNILMLAKGRVDCILIENLAFDHQIKTLREAGYYRASDAVPEKAAFVGRDPVFIGYSRSALGSADYPWALEFMQRFDSIIYQMRKAGEIKRIMRQLAGPTESFDVFLGLEQIKGACSCPGIGETEALFFLPFK